MWYSKEELDALLVEYKEICANLRERHRTIWYVRSFYLVGLTAFATYGGSVKLSWTLIIAFFAFMSVLMLAFDAKYQRTKKSLEERAIEIEKRIGIMSQYTRIQTKRRIHYLLQVTMLYILFFSAMTSWFMALIFQ